MRPWRSARACEMSVVYDSPFAKVSYEIDGDCMVFLMTMCSKQNMFSPDSIKSFDRVFDLVVEEAVKRARQDPAVTRAALVTTGHSKFYSTGLMLQEPSVQADLPHFLAKQYLPLMGKLLVLPMVTVAAINGHAFAGGMTMALSHDFRVMREKRGFMCMNEVELPSPVPSGMAAVARAKISDPAVVRDCLLEAKRFTAEEARAHNFIDALARDEADCIRVAKEMAKEQARLIALFPIVQSIKRDLYPEAIGLLEDPGSMKHVPELIMKSKL